MRIPETLQRRLLKPHTRVMILVFTSSLFTTWIEEHVATSSGGTFNPYLSFLFICL